MASAVLALSTSAPADSVAADAGVAVSTVRRWARLYHEHGAAALAARNGGRRSDGLSPEKLDVFFDLTRGLSPNGLPWTTRALARAARPVQPAPRASTSEVTAPSSVATRV